MKTFKNFTDIAPAEQIARWEECLRVLRGLTLHERKKHWDMRDWGSKTPCGTVACAAGHCGLDPWFRRRGFQLNFTYETPGGDWDFSMSDVERFFGQAGSTNIFYKADRRPVGTVIREVRAHIKSLKSAA